MADHSVAIASHHSKAKNVAALGTATCDSRLSYATNARRIPAATAEPSTPATLGPIACINKKL